IAPGTAVTALLGVAGAWVAVRAVYRAFCTPLRRVPGPLICRFTNALVYYYVFRGKFHEFTTRLHAQYGEVVRIGYNQVSLANPSELRRILATHNFRKSKVIERGIIMASSTFSTSDPAVNKQRRRQLGPAYSISALRALEDTVIEHGAQALVRSWDRRIEQAQAAGAVAEVNYYYGFHGIAFDIIGVLGLGRSFGMAADGNTRIVDAVRQHMKLVIMSGQLSVVGQWRWLMPTHHAARDYVISVAKDAIARRRSEMSDKGKPPSADILQKIIDAHDPETGERLSGPSLTVEVMLTLIAGTDTTSNTLSFTMMHLLNHPTALHRVQHDVRQAFPDSAAWIRYDEAKVHVPFLTAVILESMRLHPAVNGYLPRATPAGGAVLLGTYALPADTIVTVSIGACHRNPGTWERPLEFDPERFMGAAGATRAKDVIAFSSGVRVCLGRNLAWVELYTTLANILRRYNFEIPADAPYGPHRCTTASAAASASQPEAIPSTSFVTFGPDDPCSNCRVRIAPAL
ncbi:hypothetical protein H4R19_005141, partial [Coemansia spiralis]